MQTAIRTVWLLTFLLLRLQIAGPVQAKQEGDAPAAGDWERTGLTDSAAQLFVPRSGALLARTDTALMRSDDGGATWRSVPLPPGPLGALTVDPTDHTIVYAVGPAGLYKTTDDAQTWHVILGSDLSVPVVTCWMTGDDYLSGSCDSTQAPPGGVQVWPIDHLAISPANHNMLYLTFRHTDGLAVGLLRSQDGGQSWQPLRATGESSTSPFDLSHYLFVMPHPIAPNRVFLSYTFLGSHFGDTLSYLEQSRDGGETWTTSGTSGRTILALVGGQSTGPMRWFAAVRRGGYSPNLRRVVNDYPDFLRSDDDGLTWTSPSTFSENDGSQPSSALASDPLDPDRLYSGLGLADSPNGVKTSSDGGATWSEFGRQDIGHVNDIAAGFDGNNLFVATDEGVWRLPLSRPGDDQP